MLPVEPRTVRRRLIGVLTPISYEQGDVVYRRGRKEQAVYAVKHPPVAWEEGAEILHVEYALQGRFEEVPALAGDRDNCPDYQGFRGGVVEEEVSDGADYQHGQEEATGAALDGLLRAQAREQHPTAEEAPGKIRPGVGDPGPHHGYEDEDDAVSSIGKQAEMRQRRADPERHQQDGEYRAQRP